jgi:KaiC/GvpD/RAD55 family RecA-like ATPase
MQELVMPTRVPTGIPGLDQQIKGGFPSGSLILLAGPPGTGKSMFGAQFLLNGIENDSGGVLVDTCQRTDNIRELAGEFRWDRTLIDKIRPVDCFNFRIGERAVNTVHIGSFGEVIILINELLGTKDGPLENGGRIVVDSFSDFILYNSLESSLRFLQVLRTSLKYHQKNSVTTLIILDSGDDDQKTVQSLEYVTDGTIKLNANDRGRFLMVSRMKATPTTFAWTPFKIEDGKGLALS